MEARDQAVTIIRNDADPGNKIELGIILMETVKGGIAGNYTWLRL